MANPTIADQRRMISRLFFSLLPVQVTIMAMGSINSIADGVVAARSLVVNRILLAYAGQDGLSALSAKNVGIRLVHALAGIIEYQSLLGMNILSITIA